MLDKEGWMRAKVKNEMREKYGQEALKDIYPERQFNNDRDYRELRELRLLYKSILEDLSHEQFTWEDIDESFNAHTEVESNERIKYSKKQLEQLIERGLVEAIPETKPQGYKVAQIDDDFAYEDDPDYQKNDKTPPVASYL